MLKNKSNVYNITKSPVEMQQLINVLSRGGQSEEISQRSPKFALNG